MSTTPFTSPHTTRTASATVRNPSPRECAICQETATHAMTTRMLCGHAKHICLGCVNQLVNTVCPFCREALQPHTVHNETSLLERPTKRAKIARETEAGGTGPQTLTFQD